jgi:hypothetical protein
VFVLVASNDVEFQWKTWINIRVSVEN